MTPVSDNVLLLALLDWFRDDVAMDIGYEREQSLDLQHEALTQAG